MLPLAPQRPPLVPEIELALVAPCVDLGADPRALGCDAPPYWAFCWASGQALARFVLDAPQWVRGQSVVDLGAGSGVVAIAAALAGAARVVACDVDPDARAAALANARRNGVALAVASDLDLALACGAGVVLAADVCYEPGLVARLGSIAAHATVLLADPERRGPPLPEAALERLARVAARTLPDVGEATEGSAIARLRRHAAMLG